ncbi:FBF1 factor, partial [Atrichornis clamosus]|nr:FBF1 factor [Atrichornis clamosus]
PRFPLLAPFPQRSAREHRDGEQALREARSVQAQHRHRLQALQEQLEQLRQQEQPSPSLFPGAGQERLSLARQRQQLQEELSPRPGTLLGTLPVDGLGNGCCPVSLAAPRGARGLLPGFLPPLGMILGGSGHPPGSAALSGHLLLLKHRARMDHDFLENERLFLESLKKGP